MTSSAVLASLETLLGLKIKDHERLMEAVTHRSYAARHYERLEFLGDSVLNCVIAHLLQAREPQAGEGELSRWRAYLVREESLAEIGQQLGLSAWIRLGEGERRSGGQHRPALIADVLEALIAVVFLEAGFDAAERWVAKLFEPRWQAATAAQRGKDAKTRLQEYLQARQLDLPSYRVLVEGGLPHSPRFRVSCSVPARQVMAEAEGLSRKAAEQLAADQVLQQLEQSQQKPQQPLGGGAHEGV